MNKIIMPDGQQTPLFRETVDNVVNAFLDGQKNNETHRVQFIAVGVYLRDGRPSYWGIIDVTNTPDEDIFIEFRQRMYAAYRTLKEENIAAMAIFDMGAVFERMTYDKPQAS